MSKTITISDETYENIATSAALDGFENIEQYLNEVSRLNFSVRERRKELLRRREVGKEIREFQAKMREKYGVMPDSAALVREDRER